MKIAKAGTMEMMKMKCKITGAVTKRGQGWPQAIA
jgi:hypothetical protein